MGKKLKKRTRNGGQWTESMYFSAIRQALRTKFRYWKPGQVALNNASRPSQSKNKLLKKEYQCNCCKGWFPRKEVEIDHIVECGSLKDYNDIIPFLKRLTPETVSSYQILCKKKCHKEKTDKYKKSKTKKK